MGTRLNEPLQLIPDRVGRPRLSKDSRIIARFYEPLYMLRALGQTRGAHTNQPRMTDVVTNTRRRFLENLCFICDFTKGGKSCTAIGLEECLDKYQFWVSSNGSNSEIIKFLEEVLRLLCRISGPRQLELATVNNQFIHLCADFAKSRIEEERKLIRVQARECLSRVQNQKAKTSWSSVTTADNTSQSRRIDLDNLILMLETLISHEDLVRLCEFAHEHRQSTWLTDLKTLALRDELELNPEAKRSCFFLARHYIGRLAHHIRAPIQLVKDSFYMQHVLETYTIMAVDPLAGAKPPLRDQHTNVRGIMNRMFKAHDADKERIEAGLISLHKVSGLFDKFLSFYKQSESCVHAEIQVLEHFHWSQLAFAGNDPFIACSKPVCLCCELYFKHHPVRMVTPSSHKKVWTNWSPPRVQNSALNEDMVTQQIRILSKITHDVREQVIDQVLQRTSQSLWHPDSTTGITESLVTSFQGFSLEFQAPEASDTDSSSDSVHSSESEI